MEKIRYKKEESVLCNIEIDSNFLKDLREIAEKRKTQNLPILGDDEAKLLEPEDF